MYNNFLAEKNKKVQDHQKLLHRRLNKWLHHYRSNTRPQLITAYTQRINTFISKLEQNPKQLQRFQAPDIREQKQQHLKERLSAMEMKGGRMFKFRDTTDFKSFYGQAERMQRDQNRTIFQKRFGDSRMACRSIASQSQYDPRSQFRSRDKSKQINPPMKYTNKISPCIFSHRKTKSVIETRRKNQNNKTQISRHDQNDQQNFVRRSTSVSNSAFGQQLARSVTSIKADSQSSQDSYKNLKKLSVTLKDHNKLKKNQSGKTYFVGITDVKLNSKDPHLRKTLHNILVKVGKNRPNPRDKTLLSHVQVLSNQMN